jgi:hypothetical protein
LSPTLDIGGKPQINGKDLWQTADYQEKPVCTFLPASPVGEHPEAKNWRSYFPHGVGIPDINKKKV